MAGQKKRMSECGSADPWPVISKGVVGFRTASIKLLPGKTSHIYIPAMYPILAASLNPPAPTLVISHWSALHYPSYPGLSWGLAYLYTQVPTPLCWLTHFFRLATAGLSVVQNSFWHSSWTTENERQHICLKHKQCSLPSPMTRVFSYNTVKIPQNSQNVINLWLHRLGLKEAVRFWCKFFTLTRNHDV
jgi:hypothetical protein